MAFIKTTGADEADGDVREMYERQQESWGYVPNYAKVFSGRTEVLARWGRLLAEIRRPMSTRRFELVTFAAALVLRNTACTLQHGKMLAEHIGVNAVCKLSVGRYADPLTETEWAIFQFAQKVAADASSIIKADVDRLTDHGLDDVDVFDIVATAAGRAFFTRLLDGLGVEADSSFFDMEPQLRSALTVGRPISNEALQKLPEHNQAVEHP